MLIVFTSLMGAAQQLLEDKPIKLLSAKMSFFGPSLHSINWCSSVWFLSVINEVYTILSFY